MANFDDAVNLVLKNEGGLISESHDKGGITKFGISLRFLRGLDTSKLREYGIFEFPVDETIRDLTIDKAKEIYRGEFWNAAPFDKIGNQEQANYIFDTAINMGISPAIKCVQRAIWSVMKRREIPDDGILGVTTLAGIQRCGFLIMPAMRSERAGYYRLTVAHDETQDANLQGWLNRAYEAN
jgi:lysozyme family protein